MSLLSDIRAMILSESSVSTVISDRLYPLRLPQDPILPSVTFQKISNVEDTNLDGPMVFGMHRIQFDCYALTYLGVELLSKAIKRTLHGFSGDIGGSPPTGRISGVFHDGERDMPYEPGINEPDLKLFRRSADYLFYVDEP